MCVYIITISQILRKFKNIKNIFTLIIVLNINFIFTVLTIDPMTVPTSRNANKTMLSTAANIRNAWIFL